MNKLVFAAVLAAAFVLGNRGSAEDKDKDKDKDKPKLEIETIMEKAHEGEEKSLRNRVVSGKAEKKDAEELVVLYTELSKNEPPKGDKAAWKKKTSTILVAAKKVAADPKNEASREALEKATTCAACHKDHKP